MMDSSVTSINQAMLIRDASGPITRQFVPQRFRLSDAFKRMFRCFLDESPNALTGELGRVGG